MVHANKYQNESQYDTMNMLFMGIARFARFKRNILLCGWIKKVKNNVKEVTYCKRQGKGAFFMLVMMVVPYYLDL